MNAHFINLDKWNSFSDAEKAKLEKEFTDFQNAFWRWPNKTMAGLLLVTLEVMGVRTILNLI